MTTIETVEIVKCGGKIMELYEAFFNHNLGYNPYTEFVTDMFEKRDLIKSQGKDLLQNLADSIGLSINGGDIRKDINEYYKCVTETWMRASFDDKIKDQFPLKIGKLIENLKTMKELTFMI